MHFEIVSFDSFRKDMLKYGWREEHIQRAYDNIKLPERKTKYSAGYDIATPIGFPIKPHERLVIPTGIKVVFEPGTESDYWHLALYIRSSIGINKQVIMANQTGIIDSDYADNPDNEGDMLIALYNMSDQVVKFRVGDRIIQGIFMNHGIAYNDAATGTRIGGVGSTD